jgi:hypothetical protein
MDHLIAVFKKFFLISDHVDTNADTRLNDYIRLYESYARWAYFPGLCLFGLGLGSKSKLKEQLVLLVPGLGSWEELQSASAEFARGVLQNPAGVILALVTVTWHHAYLRHVKNETKIITSCFEREQKPQWDALAGVRFAPFIGAWLFVAFSSLCLLVGHIKWYAAVAILLNLGDFAGNEFTKNNLLKAFRTMKTRSKVLLARRQIALEYWSEKWQFTRILMMFLANVLALMMANGAFPIHIPDIVPYAVVTIGIVVNEYIITTWRLERDGKLVKFPVPEEPPGQPPQAAPKPAAKSPRPHRRSAPKPQPGSDE